jgi:hypothetical protein
MILDKIFLIKFSFLKGKQKNAIKNDKYLKININVII